MLLPHSNIINVSENTFLGISDKIVYVSINYICNDTECGNQKNGMCKLKDLISSLEGTGVEHFLKKDESNRVFLNFTYEGEYSYFSFLDCVEILNTKWKNIDSFVECSCKLRDELVKAQNTFMSFIDDMILSAYEDSQDESS